MADATPPLPPNVANFRKKLDAKTALKAERDQLERYRQSPKCPPEVHAVVDELLARFDANRPAIIAEQTAKHAAVFSERSNDRGRSAPAKGENATAADPRGIGEPFHNPYTFMPFGTKPVRRLPTLLTADEADPSRFTGVLRLKVKTLSPLLSCMPTEKDGPHVATTIGGDVIVPATGIRGSLRTLLTVLTGGTLGYVDKTLWLTQGRDANLGPAGKSSPPGTPDRVFLARVVRPGSPTRPGVVELNALVDPLVAIPELSKRVPNLDAMRPAQGKGKSRGVVDAGGGMLARLSGRPVNWKGKREALFRGSGREVELPPDLWSAFLGRHAHADFTELKKDDLVWLEPASPDLQSIQHAREVRSIQWARWGRRGNQLLEVLRKNHPAILPDSMRDDGMVDEVTDLFGHIPDPKAPGAAAAFAGRVRADNLVFRDCAGAIDRGVQLAPLMQPHPGCIGFYRDSRDLDAISQSDPLRGYKVYRTTRERGPSAPWHYATQGVYAEGGALQPNAKVSRKCDLLREGQIGELSLSLRSLSRREVALLLAACGVDWRLGGGKPLGLGHCRIVQAALIDEFGVERLAWTPDGIDALDRSAPSAIPDPYAAEIGPELAGRRDYYQATQRPVERLRYPRASRINNNRTTRGGNVWFQRHASPKQVVDKSDAKTKGLRVLRVADALRERLGASQVRAQPLPVFDPKNPFADVLYGYDCHVTEVNGDMTLATAIEPFDAKRHARADERSGGTQGQSQATRREERERR